MATKAKLLVAAAALVVVGILLIFLQPGPPAGECVAEGEPSSGFVDDDSGCPISIESYEEISDYESAPKPFRIAGLLVVVIGLGVGGYALVKYRGGAADGPGAAAA
jgi:hypothetical protein